MRGDEADVPSEPDLAGSGGEPSQHASCRIGRAGAGRDLEGGRKRASPPQPSGRGLTAPGQWLNPKGVQHPKLVICAHCDAVHRRTPLPPRGRAHCTRCGNELYASGRTQLEAWLALATASAIAYLVANLNPIVEIDLRGESTRASLFDALVATWDGGAPPVAALAAACAFLFPLLCIALELFVLASLHAGRRPAMLGHAMRVLHTLRPWSMVEVFMLGVVVSLVKLGGQTTVIPGPGLAGFAVLTVLLTLLATFDPHSLWDAAERVSR